MKKSSIENFIFCAVKHSHAKFRLYFASFQFNEIKLFFDTIQKDVTF